MVKLGFSKDTVRGFIPPGALQGPELQRIVCQALDRVMSPSDRDAVITSALTRIDEQALPERASELTAFVFGPLRDVVEQAFDAQTAERLLFSLTPFLKQACQHDSVAPEDEDDAPPTERMSPSGRVADGMPTDDGSATSAPAPGDSAAAGPPLTSGATLLVVDSEPKARAALSQQLRDAGYEVFTAPDGHVALAVCMRNRPDAVVAALGLPTVGGRQLMALLRVAFASDAPPVVLLADAESGPTKVDGAAALITRPVELAELLRTVAEVVVQVER